MAADDLPDLPGGGRHRFLLQAAVALALEEGEGIAEGDRRADEDERERAEGEEPGTLQGDEGVRAAAEPDPRQEHHQRRPRRVLPRFAAREGSVPRQLVRPRLVVADVLQVQPVDVIPEADVGEDQGAGRNPHPDPDPQRAISQQWAQRHARII